MSMPGDISGNFSLLAGWADFGKYFGKCAPDPICTDGSVYERVCSARAAKGDSLYDLLAAGRAAALLPPGQRLFASGNAFLDDIRCYCQRSNSRHRTPRSPCAHPPAAIALTCTITHSAGLSRTIAAPTVGHGRQQRQWQQRQSGARRVCECVCVYVCIVGSSSQRFHQRKPRLISLKTARMRAKTPKFSLALRGVASWRDAAKKVEIPRQKVRSRDFDICSRKNPDGKSFM